MRRIDLANHTVTTAQNETVRYDSLISTMPLSELIRIGGQTQLDETARKGLLHSSSHILGIGLAGSAASPPEDQVLDVFPGGQLPVLSRDRIQQLLAE